MGSLDKIKNLNTPDRAQDTCLFPPLIFLAGTSHKPLGYALASHFYTGGWPSLLSRLHSQCLHKQTAGSNSLGACQAGVQGLCGNKMKSQLFYRLLSFPTCGKKGNDLLPSGQSEREPPPV